MILFVFEGNEREPGLFRTLERLYFPRNNDNIIRSYGNNIYELYNDMMALDGAGDIVTVIRERQAKKGGDILEGLKNSDFSEIFLFFDYDFQHAHLSLDEINRRVAEMLTLFNEETGNGKLYINYPMIESIRYVKELPDDNYLSYTIARKECCDFKRIAKEFSHYDSFDFIMFKDGASLTKEKFLQVHDNWEILKRMNVCKAHFLVKGINIVPKCKEDINQGAIFKAQRELFVEKDESVSILNSFPLFLYEYFK